MIYAVLFSVIEGNSQELKSPNGDLVMQFSLELNGVPTYKLAYKNKAVIKPSHLGLELKNDEKSLLNSFEISNTETVTFDETWQPVWEKPKIFAIIIMNWR
ncbi:alpha-glucosidase SusB [Algibacter lectus]|uniref:Alpha-glucosidase SusB n=1 Tax=Algibacter lectus TaxID=221126 RepID=A0A090WVW1_9FLAO|nr:alpha-glucosidase SusB [Algibacter lectus]